MSVEYRRQAACTGTRAHGHRDQPLQGQEVRSAPAPRQPSPSPLATKGRVRPKGASCQMWGSGIRVLPAAGRDRQSRRSGGRWSIPGKGWGRTRQHCATWIRFAAGVRLFSKCFCRCCSCTLRAKPEPRIPWEREGTGSVGADHATASSQERWGPSHRRGGIWPLSPQFLQGRRRRDPLPRPTHGRQREEGDAEQGEAGRQHPSQPRLRRLVPVADGGEGDLPGGRAGGSLEGAPSPRPRPTLLIPSRGWGTAGGRAYRAPP